MIPFAHCCLFRSWRFSLSSLIAVVDLLCFGLSSPAPCVTAADLPLCFQLSFFCLSADRLALPCFPAVRDLALWEHVRFCLSQKGCDIDTSCYDCKDPVCHCHIPNGFCSMLPSFFMIDYVSPLLRSTCFVILKTVASVDAGIHLLVAGPPFVANISLRLSSCVLPVSRGFLVRWVSLPVIGRFVMEFILAFGTGCAGFLAVLCGTHVLQRWC